MDAKSFRRDHLLAAIDNAVTTDNLAKITDSSPQYLSQLKTGHRAMGEKTARRLEAAVGDAPGSWDLPLTDDTAPPALSYQQVLPHLLKNGGAFTVIYEGRDMNPEIQAGFEVTINPAIPVEALRSIQPSAWWAYNSLHIGLLEKRDVDRLSFRDPVAPPLTLPDDALYCGAVTQVMFNY